MDATMAVVLALLALIMGLALGWFIAMRSNSATAAERTERAEQLQSLLDAVTHERDEAYRARATLEADSRNFDARMTDLKESKDALIAQFRAVGDQLLEKAHKDFLEKAGERFTAADKASETKLKSMLQPVEATLKRYEEGLQRVEKERVDHYAGLREVVELVRTGQGQVRDEARNLVSALTNSSKTRGNWGERSLRNVLQQAGLTQYADFRSEVSVDTDDGRLRPDVIVRLPGGGQMVIDSKISFNAYMDAHNEVDDIRKEAHLKAHLSSIKNHVTKLASKNYWDQFEGSAEFVVMYISGEHFLNAALEIEPNLWQLAYDKKVILATPTNLIALALTVAGYWRQDSLNKEAKVIAALGRELHSRLATMAQHMERLGKNLSTANLAYNQMVGSFETQVFTQTRRFEELGAKSAKDVPSPPMIEATPRPLTKFVAEVAESNSKGASLMDK